MNRVLISTVASAQIYAAITGIRVLLRCRSVVVLLSAARRRPARHLLLSERVVRGLGEWTG